MSKRARETSTEAACTAPVFLQLSAWDTETEKWVIGRRSREFEVKAKTTRFSSDMYNLITKIGYQEGPVKCDPWGFHTSSSFRLRVELYGAENHRDPTRVLIHTGECDVEALPSSDKNYQRTVVHGTVGLTMKFAKSTGISSLGRVTLKLPIRDVDMRKSYMTYFASALNKDKHHTQVEMRVLMDQLKTLGRKRHEIYQELRDILPYEEQMKLSTEQYAPKYTAW